MKRMSVIEKKRRLSETSIPVDDCQGREDGHANEPEPEENVNLKDCFQKYFL
jgi:hypothetical protein